MEKNCRFFCLFILQNSVLCHLLWLYRILIIECFDWFVVQASCHQQVTVSLSCGGARHSFPQPLPLCDTVFFNRSDCPMLKLEPGTEEKTKSTNHFTYCWSSSSEALKLQPLHRLLSQYWDSRIYIYVLFIW